jgi:hypothetical protein
MSWWFWLSVSLAGYVGGYYPAALLIAKDCLKNGGAPTTCAENGLGFALFWPIVAACAGPFIIFNRLRKHLIRRMDDTKMRLEKSK